MADNGRAFMEAIIARLKADATLTAIVGQRIYMDVVDNPTFPYLSLSLQSSAWDTKTELGVQHDLQCAVYSRTPDAGQALDARSALYNSLHRQEAALTAVGCRDIVWDGTSLVFKESDGKTWASVISFKAICD